MSRTRWTDDLLAEARRYAAAGHTMRETAANLGMSGAALSVQASKRGISFHGRRGPKPRGESPTDLRLARQGLAREIEAALREWGQTAPYRGEP
jgi:hypothetical protein